MSMNATLARNPVELVRELVSIAQIGATYATDQYDIERYAALTKISQELGLVFNDGFTPNSFHIDDGYPTPKVDVRGTLWKDGKVLLVREHDTKQWSLPGGWADLNDTPTEAIKKEFSEEVGLDVSVSKLAAVVDRDSHTYVPQLHHVYKMYFVVTGTGVPEKGHDIEELDWFSLDRLPELSEERVIRKHIELCWKVHTGEVSEPYCD